MRVPAGSVAGWELSPRVSLLPGAHPALLLQVPHKGRGRNSNSSQEPQPTLALPAEQAARGLLGFQSRTGGNCCCPAAPAPGSHRLCLLGPEERFCSRRHGMQKTILLQALKFAGAGGTEGNTIQCVLCCLMYTIEFQKQAPILHNSVLKPCLRKH